MRKNAKNWSKPYVIANVTGGWFDFLDRRCFAFYKPGPQFAQGFQYVLRGFVCGALGKGEVTEAQIAKYLGTVRVRLGGTIQ